MPWRSIRETNGYANAKQSVIERLGVSARIFEDFVATFDDVLASEPEIYPEVIDGLCVRMVRTRKGLMPQLRFWYAIVNEGDLEHYVDLLWVDLVDDGTPEE